MFDDIIKAALVGVPDDIKKALADQLKHIAEKFLTRNIVKVLAHNVLKGIDALVVASVHVLTADQIIKLTGAYRDEIDRQFVLLNQAIGSYISLQVAVEIAKKEHGNHSPEAEAARAKRAAGIAEVNKEFGDLFAAIFGEHVQD